MVNGGVIRHFFLDPPSWPAYVFSPDTAGLLFRVVGAKTWNGAGKREMRQMKGNDRGGT